MPVNIYLDRHLVVYDNFTDCMDKIKYYIEHNAEREKIAKAGHEYALEHHTFDARAKELLTILGKEI